MITIQESGMTFGPFDESQVYNIEKSDLYKNLKGSIKTVEFILSRDMTTLSFIEAKSSSPRPTRQNKERFQDFITEITQKFLHSFNLYYSAILGRKHLNADMPEKFRQIDQSMVQIKFILVISNHQIEWLAPLKVALEQSLAVHSIIWGSDVAVLNDTQAKQWHLIS